MKADLIKKLCCPFDKSGLKLTIITKDTEGNILEGFFHCPECNRIYPVIKGIPIMNPDEYREFKLEQPLMERWSKHLDGRINSEFRLVKEGGELKIEN